MLVNSTDKRRCDGTAGMDPKVSRTIPSQKGETALKRNSFVGTSGKLVFSSNEKYQCPDGTETCELPSGRNGCCPIRTARWIKIIENNPPPHSSEGMLSFGNRTRVFLFL